MERSSFVEKSHKGSCLILIVCLLLLPSLQELASGGREGFISIDCGQTYTYNDKKTGLKYVPDTNFIDSGENNQISSYFRGVLDGNADYAQSDNLRSFPNGTRNCYTLRPVLKGKKYLLRAFFRYGNYDGKDILPSFDLYLGANLWYHVQIINSSRNSYTEIITVAPANSISVCLLNRNTGVPFISALELRPLNDSLYKEVDTSSSLVLRSTHDCGVEGDTQIRYPDDSYDRLWNPYLRHNWTRLETSGSINTSMGEYQPPSKIMKTAGTPKSGLELNYYNDLQKFEWTKDAVGPPKYYVFLHFAEFKSLSINDSRIFNVKLNDEAIGFNVTPKYMSTTTITNGKPQNYDEIILSLYSVIGSTLPPILNALRIYVYKPLNENNTDSHDVDAIMEIKDQYKVKRDWMGDPCVPLELSWKGLKCSYEVAKSPRIISLNLSSSGLSGKLTEFVANLTELEHLDLSINNLGGEIPDFLANLAHLNFLNLTRSGLHGIIPRALQDKSEKGSLTLSSDDSANSANSANSKKTVVIVVVSICSAFFVLLMVSIFVWRRKKQIKDSCKRDSSHPSAALLKQNNDGFHLQFESRKFTYSELIGITNNFSKVLGQGGFGTVYCGMLANGNAVAVKVLSELSSQGPKEFQNEAQLLTRIHHRNLVPLVGYCYDKDHLALVYECMEEGTLESHLSGQAGRTTVLSWRERLKIALEAAQGLEYLHKGCKSTIVHRDVKTSNILLNKNMEARISDFGLSKIFEKDGVTHVSTVVMGTRGYLDPEYNTTNQLNEKSDVYSFGIVLLELITGKPAIVRITDEPTHIIDWVQPGIEQGDLCMIVDHKLGEAYDVNSIWKAIEAALACTPIRSSQRITMSEVVILLKECLDLERNDDNCDNTNHSVSYGNSSNLIGKSMTSYGTLGETISTDITTTTHPPAR